jgi:ribosomal protein L19
MTGDQSRKLKIGDRVHWKNDVGDAGTVTENTWSGVVIKWDNRGPQTIMHNDMVDVSFDHLAQN